MNKYRGVAACLWPLKLLPTGVLVVKNSPANAGDVKRHGFNPWVGKIPLEEDMATHSSVLAWRIPWKEESGGLGPIAVQRVRHD